MPRQERATVAQIEIDDDDVERAEWSTRSPYLSLPDDDAGKREPGMDGGRDRPRDKRAGDAGARDIEHRKRAPDDPHDEAPPIIYGEEIPSPCNPRFVRGIAANDCTIRGVAVPWTCNATITGFIWPGSRWMNNVGGAIAEINRAFEFYARYCIFLRLDQLVLKRETLRKMQRFYAQWYPAVVQAVGGVDHLGSTTIPTDLIDAFRGSLFNLQAAAHKKGVKLLVVFMDEYITDHRPSLVTGTRRDVQQIGVNWIDRQSPHILAHELGHAFGKSANGVGPVTWFHNSICHESIMHVPRTDERLPGDWSNRVIDEAEYREIVAHRGGGVLACGAGGCQP